MSKTRRQPGDEEVTAFAAGKLRDGLEESEEDEFTSSKIDSRQLAASCRRVAGLAVSAVLAVALGWLAYIALPQPDGPGQLAAQLSARLTGRATAIQLNQQAWRGDPVGNIGGAVGPSVASFRLGRFLLDLEIARLADDFSRGRSLLGEVQSLLTIQRAGPMALDEAAQALRKVDAQQSLQSLEHFPEQIALSLPASWDPFYLSFGHWAEAARLACRQHDLDFFQQAEFEDFALQLQGREDLDPRARRAWESARMLLGKPARNPDDWDELAQRCADLIRLH